MTDFFIKVPDDKTEFFTELMENLGLDYEQLFSNDDESHELNDESGEFFYTDSDD